MWVVLVEQSHLQRLKGTSTIEMKVKTEYISNLVPIVAQASMAVCSCILIPPEVCTCMPCVHA